MNSKKTSCFVCGALALGLLLTAAPAVRAQTRSATGLGPFVIQTARGNFNVRLLRRDKDMLWVIKEADAGGSFEAGIPLAELRLVEVPPPRVFAVVDQATGDTQIRAAHDGLDRLMQSLKPFRGLPGVPYEDAMLNKGKLYARQGLWREAVRSYEDILQQPHDTGQKTPARIRAGIAYELAGEHENALKHLEGATIPEDDEELLSSALFARGAARGATGDCPGALMDYLYLVVFHPYAQNNEARCLEAALPCYAELKDWESFLKTVQWLRREYPASRETARAEELFAEHREHLQYAGQFVDGETEPPPVKAGDEAAPAPASTPEAGEATIDDIEVD